MVGLHYTQESKITTLCILPIFFLFSLCSLSVKLHSKSTMSKMLLLFTTCQFATTHVQRMAEERLPKIAMKWMPKQKGA